MQNIAFGFTRSVHLADVAWDGVCEEVWVWEGKWEELWVWKGVCA